jgi:RNA polymerase sigma-70 factor (ECF subfamily)
VDENELFRHLIRRVRAGDAEAATQLVRRYEREIRRAVRVRLANPALGRVLDSTDLCQSVLGRFFVRVASGQFELDRPEQLLKLLVTMARNRLRDHARRLRARKGDRHLEGGDEVLKGVPAGEASPSRVLAGRELLARVLARLPPPERYLAEQRAQGREWAGLAAEVGGSPEALRKRLGRALDRVLRELGPEGVTLA